MNFDVLKKAMPSSYEIQRLSKSISNKNIVIYGAGQGGYGAKKYFQEQDLTVLYFSDSDSNRYNKDFYGIKCIDKNMIKAIDNVCVFVCVRMHYTSVSEFLVSEGVEHYNFDTFMIPNTIDRLEKVYNLLDDSLSKKIYLTILLSRYYSETEEIAEIFTENHYFDTDEFSEINEKEVFVDCGAFIGDTLDRVLNKTHKFTKYYAFEAFNKNYEALVNHVNMIEQEHPSLKEKIVIESKAVSDINGSVGLTVDFDDVAVSASFSSDTKSNNRIDSVKLDDYFLDKEPPTFIKADIESNEMQMLFGATETIKKYKPKLAISIYHKYEDLYLIVEYIHSLDSNYKFKVRHHTYVFYDTVLYAWVE